MIRFILGLVIVLGAVGGADQGTVGGLATLYTDSSRRLALNSMGDA